MVYYPSLDLHHSILDYCCNVSTSLVFMLQPFFFRIRSLHYDEFFVPFPQNFGIHHLLIGILDNANGQYDWNMTNFKHVLIKVCILCMVHLVKLFKKTVNRCDHFFPQPILHFCCLIFYPLCHFLVHLLSYLHYSYHRMDQQVY